MNKKVVRYLGCVVLGTVFIICFIFLVDFYTLDGASLDTGKNIGEPIIRALEQYHTDLGIYPGILVSLVPKYMDSIPQPAWRYQFGYDTCSANKNYVLWFRRSNDVDTYCGYVSFKKEWRCSDSIPPKCENEGSE